jgi:hypothetical protein
MSVKDPALILARPRAIRAAMLAAVVALVLPSAVTSNDDQDCANGKAAAHAPGLPAVATF